MAGKKDTARWVNDIRVNTWRWQKHLEEVLRFARL